MTLMPFHAAAGGGNGDGGGGGQCIPVMWVAETLICYAWEGSARYNASLILILGERRCRIQGRRGRPLTTPH